MTDPASIVIGLGGILIAFKGVVDSVNLVALILSKDNGEKALALKYNIERHRISVWGDEFKARDETSRPLTNVPKATRILIAGILAELGAMHDRAEKLLRRHPLNPPSVPSDLVDGEDLVKLVDKVRADRDKAPQKNRILWALADKAKFTEIVDCMTSLVDDLYSIVPPDKTQALASALSAYLLPKLEDSMSLMILQLEDFRKDPLLSLSARLKQLREAPELEVAKQAIWHDYAKDFFTDTASPNEQRQLGFLEVNQEPRRRCWIEWKTTNNSLTAGDAQIVSQRIEAIAVLLSNVKSAEFHIPECIGLLEDRKWKRDVQGRSRKLGLIFAWPSTAYATSGPPRSLYDVIENDQPALLSDRFDVAYKLASSLSLLHASKWLHKGFRSHNILLFQDESKKLMITEPYLTGFDYSRPESQASVETMPTGQPEIDIYYHPDVGLHGFNGIRELYSLGVVLLEIAFWIPMGRKVVEEGLSLGDMTSSEVRFFMIKSTEELGSLVGPSYRDAVLACLTGDFDISLKDGGAELGRAFFNKVLRKLSHCRA